MKKTIAVLLLLCLMAGCLTGCQKNPAPVSTGLADYLASMEAQSKTIKNSLAQEELTQTEMNQKSGELCSLWDMAMNRMLEEAQKVLPSQEMEALTAKQSAWLENRTQAMDAAGKEFEGGSMYALTVNMVAAELTEARVYELYAMLK